MNPLLLYLLMLWFSTDVTVSTEELFSFRGTFFNGEPMGVPSMVHVFSDGSFVLHEYDSQTLKKFDSEGRFIQPLSREGRGPGEFLDIDHIFIDAQDRLIVVDHIQLKLTVLENESDISDHFIFNSRPSIRSVHQLQSGQYIFGFTNYSSSGILESPELFYLVQQNFEIQTTGFVPPGHLHHLVPGSVPEIVMRGSKRLTDNSIVTVNDDLLVAPSLYNGRMLLYSKSFDYKEFEIIEVSNDYGPPFEEFKEPGILNSKIFNEEGFSMVNNPSGRISFLHFNRSLGLYQLNTGQIIHFVQIKNGDNVELIAEILDDKGRKVLSTQKLDFLGKLNVQENITEFREYSSIDLVFHHLDHKNRLFVSRFGENGEPELYVIQIDVEF